MKARMAAALGVVALIVSAALYAEDKNPLEGVKCIIQTTKPAKADKSVDYKGGKVYFCCANCPKAFDPAKHGTKANHQLVATGQAKQAKCPLTGKDVDTTTKISVAGADVCFCCNNCKGAVEKLKGDEQIAKVFSDAAFEKAGYKVGKKE